MRAPEGAGEAGLAQALVELGGRSVEEREGVWTTHLPPPTDPEAFVRDAERRIRRTPGLSAVELDWGWQPHEAWAESWRRGLGIRRVGRFVVRPSWCPRPDLAPRELLVELDPGVAFGTAEHGSTRGCLHLLEDAVRPGDRVLDVGAGSGILSLAAARLGAESVLAVESDPMAADAARENAERNGLAGTIEVVSAAVDPPWLRARTEPPFHGTVANLQTGLLLPLLPALAASVRGEGWLVLGGILVEERAEMEAALRSLPVRLEGEGTDEGWWSVRLAVDAPASAAG